MTQASDESTLGRGSDLSRRYRQLPVDSVPADLDRLILEHARAAVAMPDTPPYAWIRWVFPLSLVGTAVLAATLVLDGFRKPPSLPSPQLPKVVASQRQEAGTGVQTAPIVETASVETASVEPAASGTGLNSTAASSSAPQAPARTLEPQPVMTARATQREPQVAPPVADVAPEPASAAGALASEVPMAAAASSANPIEAPALSASTAAIEAPAPPAAESQSAFEGLDALKSSSMSPARQQAAEELLEDIRYLRQTGRNRGADKAWRNFLQDYPNYPVAADDIARPRD